MISYDIYLFHYSSLSTLLKVMNYFNIPVKKYYEYGKDYYLKIPRKYRRLVKDKFVEVHIVDGVGVINFIERLMLKPITLVSLILSIFLFMNLSSRLYDISFNGDYPYIEKEIVNSLKEYELYKWGYFVEEEKLDDIEGLLKEKYNNDLESLDLYKRGNKLIVNYKKRRKINDLEENKGSLYASKDGVIASFDVIKGVKVVKVNDFVRKGDLLVSEIVINNKDEGVSVGGRGSVYAYTYYFIEVNDTYKKSDEVEVYSTLLDKARKEVSKNINSDREYIKEENILVCDLSNQYLKIYYVLYEDITI